MWGLAHRIFLFRNGQFSFCCREAACGNWSLNCKYAAYLDHFRALTVVDIILCSAKFRTAEVHGILKERLDPDKDRNSWGFPQTKSTT